MNLLGKARFQIDLPTEFQSHQYIGQNKIKITPVHWKYFNNDISPKMEYEISIKIPGYVQPSQSPQTTKYQDSKSIKYSDDEQYESDCNVVISNDDDDDSDCLEIGPPSAQIDKNTTDSEKISPQKKTFPIDVEIDIHKDDLKEQLLYSHNPKDLRPTSAPRTFSYKLVLKSIQFNNTIEQGIWQIRYKMEFYLYFQDIS